MKRILSLLFALSLMVCVLSACQSSGDSGEQEQEHDHIWLAETGKCEICGRTHPHDWTGGGGVCAGCGYHCPHDFEDHICTVCGVTTIFQWKYFPVDTAYAVPNEQGGTVEKVDYETHAYPLELANPDVGDIIVTKTMYVYKPWDYDESRQYDVLFLMHGGGEDEGYWFCQGRYQPDEGYGDEGRVCFTKELLDNLIANGEMEPVIVVTPTTNVSAEGFEELEDDSLLTEFYHEFQNVILPYVAEHYATYAASGEKEDLVAARDHFGFAGLSNGSVTTWNSILKESLEYVSWIGCFSAGPTWSVMPEDDPTGYEAVAASVNEKAAEYPIHYFFNGDGTYDMAHKPHVAAYAYMMENCPNVLTDGDGTAGNAAFVDILKGEHAYPNWIVMLYNVTQVFFK